ncbi:MAG: hypothetical protein LBG13_01495 [Holosporales bacterium]|nr:hypothetical protein [Holosporales bacterium]
MFSKIGRLLAISVVSCAAAILTTSVVDAKRQSSVKASEHEKGDGLDDGRLDNGLDDGRLDNGERNSSRQDEESGSSDKGTSHKKEEKQRNDDQDKETTYAIIEELGECQKVIIDIQENIKRMDEKIKNALKIYNNATANSSFIDNLVDMQIDISKFQIRIDEMASKIVEFANYLKSDVVGLDSSDEEKMAKLEEIQNSVRKLRDYREEVNTKFDNLQLSNAGRKNSALKDNDGNSSDENSVDENEAKFNRNEDTDVRNFIEDDDSPDNLIEDGAAER